MSEFEALTAPQSVTATLPTPKISGKFSFEVETGGDSVSNNQQVLSITVFKAVNKIPSAKIVIADGFTLEKGESIADNDHFKLGKTVVISAGYNNNNKPVFEGIIIKQSIERNSKCRQIVLECKDVAVKLTVGEKDRGFSDTKDSEIIEEVLNAYKNSPGVGAVEAKIDNKKDARKQEKITDWDFLLKLAQENGAMLFADKGMISVTVPDMDKKPALALEYGTSILEFKASSDARDRQQAVKTAVWDPATQKFIEVESEVQQDNAVQDETVTGITTEIRTVAAETYSEQEAQVKADAAMLRSRLAQKKGSVKTFGFSDISPGDLVELKKVGKRFNGKAFVAAVRHEIGKGKRGWITELQIGLDTDSPTPRKLTTANTAGETATTAGLQIGKVTQLQDDPKGEDRIEIKIPGVKDNSEEVWARVACMDAGENRGTFFRPEIDDEVVLGFLNNDPRYPVVLGMLNSSAKPAPLKAEDKNPEKGFITREAIKLIFNDEKKTVKIETPNGNTVILSDEDGTVTLKDENRNRVVMDTNGITLESGKDLTMKAQGDIKIEGINMELAAQAQFKGTGDTGAELSSAKGQTIVRGTTVMIN